MPAIMILGISIALQFLAATLALYLIRMTGRWWAWGLIAIAMTSMGVRQSITFSRIVSSDTPLSADLTAELVTLCISVLMVLGIVLIGPIFKRMQQTRSALGESEARYRELFDDSPSAIWVEDWSAIKERLDALAAEGVSDWHAYFAEQPGELERTYDLARQVDISNAAVALYHAASKTQAQRHARAATVAQDELDAHALVFAAFASGETRFDYEARKDTVDGAEMA